MATKTGTATPSKSADKPLAKTTTETFQLERPQVSIEQVRWDLIDATPDKYGFRRDGDAQPYGKELLGSMMESLKFHGRLLTPLGLRAKPDGRYDLADGHRRYFGLGFLIGEGVKPFTHDMLVPANVMNADTSELAMIATAIAGNVEREALTFEGRLDAVKRLNQLGMPKRSIAEILRVSESTVDRDLIVANDDEMREHIRKRNITASAAATLLAAAEKAGRRKEFLNCFLLWLLEANESLKAEEKAREERDLPLLPAAKRWLQNRLTAEQVAAWRRALEAGKPLDAADRTVPFPAFIQGEGVNAHITIGAVSKPVSELTSADLAKILRNCLDVAADIEPILLAKAAAEREAAPEVAGKRISAGQRRLIELGVAADVSDDEPDDDEPDDDEPDDDDRTGTPPDSSELEQQGGGNS